MSSAPSSATPRQWIAVLGAMLGAFMAVLDIQITNASLKDILGTLGATMEEGSWVSTSYLVAEIIVIPLTAWLAVVFSTHRYLLCTTAGFLLSSVACAWAWDLSSLIVFRVVQGFTGGAMIPMALALVLRLLPPRDHAKGFAMFGMTATFAPAIGPSIGGWLTENFGWPWIFFLNLLPGAIMLGALAWGLDKEPAELSRFKSANWPGILTMALGLGCLITVLEEGHRHDWLASATISCLAAIAVSGLVASVVLELRARQPFLDLRLLGQRSFGIGCLISTIFGLGMYGVMYLLPVYLAQVQGYHAGQIGATIMWSGVPQVLMMPVAAVLAMRIDARVLITAGLACFAGSCLMNGALTPWTAHDQLKASQMIRAIGMPLVIVPLTSLATRGMAISRAGSASALFNMLRNLGGSIGIALLATRIDSREKWHSVHLGESVSLWRTETWERMQLMAAHFAAGGADPATAGKQSLAALELVVRRQAYVLSFADGFTLLGLLLAATIPLVWLLPAGKAGGAVSVH